MNTYIIKRVREGSGCREARGGLRGHERRPLRDRSQGKWHRINWLMNNCNFANHVKSAIVLQENPGKSVEPNHCMQSFYYNFFSRFMETFIKVNFCLLSKRSLLIPCSGYKKNSWYNFFKFIYMLNIQGWGSKIFIF